MDWSLAQPRREDCCGREPQRQAMMVVLTFTSRTVSDETAQRVPGTRHGAVV